MALDRDFEHWLCSTTGLELNRGGAGPILNAAVERRCRELRCSESEYTALVRQLDGRELEQLINSVTVVYTWFFRDPGQLAGVEEALRRWSSPRPLRVWIPGCATGEDVYSVGVLAEQLGVEARILGTDVNTRALAVAERGEYAERDLRNVEPPQRGLFTPLPNGRWTLIENVRRRVCFARHNLVDPVPRLDGASGFDLILCRNVFIYFEAERALRVFHNLARALEPEGYLLLGASEIVYDVPPELRAVQLARRIAFQRVGAGSLPSVPPARLDSPVPRAPVSQPPVPAGRPAERRRESYRPRLLAPSLPVMAPPPEPPNDVAAEFLLNGHDHLARGRLADALEQFERAVTANPASAEAWMHLGIVRYLRGEVEQAAKDLRAALVSGEPLVVAIFYLALSYESMGLPAEALREYRRLVQCADGGFSAPAHDPLGGWYGDMVQLARHRLARAKNPSAARSVRGSREV